MPDNYFELAIVDPPYGIGMDKRTLSNHASNSKKFKNYFEYMGFELDKDYFDKAKERIEKFDSQENMFEILNEIEELKPKQESLF